MSNRSKFILPRRYLHLTAKPTSNNILPPFPFPPSPGSYTPSSLDLAAEYEKAKAASEKATEASTVNYTKKRSIAGEVKHYREQKEEIERWEELKKERVSFTSLTLGLVRRGGRWRGCGYGCGSARGADGC